MLGLYVIFAMITSFIADTVSFVTTQLYSIVASKSTTASRPAVPPATQAKNTAANPVANTAANPVANTAANPVANTAANPVANTAAAHRASKMLYNHKDYIQYQELSKYFLKYPGDLKPIDYDKLNTYCRIGDKYPTLQDVVYKSWCPAICHTGLTDFRDAENKIIPFWNKGLGSAQKPLINDMCVKASVLSKNGCDPDVTKDVYWQALCQTPDCTAADLAWLDAEKGLEDLQSVNANTEVQNNHVATHFCPIINALVKSCPADHIASRYAGDPYYKLCQRGSDCPTVSDAWNKAAEPVRTMEAGSGYTNIINEFCKHGKDMSRCGYDFYAIDPLYQEWCTDPGCVSNYLAFLDERKNLEWQVSQGVSEDGQIQEMQSRFCPAAQNLLDNCKDVTKTNLVTNDPYYKDYCKHPKCTTNRLNLLRKNADLYNQVSQNTDQNAIYQTMIRDVCPAFEGVITECKDETIKSDKYYKDYCTKPGCTKVRYALLTAQKDFDYQVSQGVSQNAQLQMLQTRLCPAMKTVIDEPSCDDTDRQFVQQNPYYKQYCSDSDCIPVRIALDSAESNFENQARQNPDPNAMYQTAFDSLCPAYNAALTTCKSTDLHDWVNKNPYYQQYCRNETCAKLQFKEVTAQKDFDYQVSQGISQNAQLQTLQTALCPAMQAVMDEPTCVGAAQAAITNNIYYKQYCSDASCLQPRIALDKAESDFQNQITQNADQNALFQTATNSLCPAYQTALKNCKSADILDHINKNPYYQQYCVYPKCAADKNQLFVSQKDFDYQVSQGIDQNAQLQMLQTRLCPAMQTIIDEPTCDDTERQFVQQNPYWKKVCHNAACIPYNIAMVQAESDFQNQITQHADEDAQWQTATRSLCPAYQAVLTNCQDADLTAHITQNPYYQQYCANPKCAADRDTYFKAEKDFDYQVSQGIDQNAQLQILQKSVCPAMQTIMDEPTCGDAQRSSITQNLYWNKVCKNATCIPYNLAMIHAESDFQNQITQHADEDAQWQTATQSLCPAYQAVLANCTDPDLAAHITQNPYYQQYCANPKCAADRDTYFKAEKDFDYQVSQGIPQDAMLQILQKSVCPAMQTIMDEPTCGDAQRSSITQNPNWNKVCKNATCIPYNLAMIRAEADFQNQVTQHADADVQWQTATRSLCPAYQAVLANCTDPDLAAHITQNPYYQQYCANPTCAAAQDTYYKAQRDFDYQLPQGNSSGQLQMLQTTLCPAMQQIMNDTTCNAAVRATVTQNPYWKKYCSDMKCLPAQQQVDAAETAFNWGISQHVTEDGQWQAGFQTLCPAYKTALAGCDPASDEVQHIMSNPYYHKYCEFPDCAQKKYLVFKNETDFAYQVGQGLNTSGQYQTLINTVCPSLHAAYDTCTQKADIEKDYYWNKYCRDAACMVPQQQLSDALTNFRWNVSPMDKNGLPTSGIDQSGQYQLAFRDLCPAYAGVRATCTDAAALAGISNDPLYQQYCQYQDCAQKQYKLYQAEKDWNWAAGSTNQDGQYQGLIATVCPAMIDVHDNCSDPSAKGKVEADPLWQYCRDGTACMSSRLDILRAYNDYNASNLQHPMDDDAKWQTAQRTFCPAFAGALNSCKGNQTIIDSVTNDIWYKKYCKFPQCARDMNDVYNQEKSLNWDLSQGLDENGKYQELLGKICPSMSAAQAACDPAGPESQQIASDPLWTQYCSFGQTCLSNKHDILTKIKDIEWGASQGVTADGTTQLVLAQLCPIFTSTLASCQDTATQSAVKTNHYWKDYCEYSDCTRSVQDLRNKQKDFNYAMSNGTNVDGMYQMLINSVCPAYASALQQTCQPGLLDQLKAETQYTQYCATGTTCLTNQLNLVHAENNLNQAMSQGLSTDGMYQLLQSQVCPSMKALEQSCPDVATKLEASDKWYDPYCKYIGCTTTKQQYNQLMTNYNNTYPVLNDSGKAQVVAATCPIFNTIAQTCPPATVAQLNQGPIYDQCRADARCPIWRYSRDAASNSLNGAGNFYNMSTNYANTYNDYCGKANLTLNSCGDFDANYKNNPNYIKWCANTPCRDTVMNLNYQIKDKGYSMNYVNDFGKRYLTDNYVCPNIRALPQMCDAATVADYLQNENQGWFGYFLGRCPIPSSTDKTKVVMVRSDAQNCMAWDRNADQSQVYTAPCDPTHPNQLWYKDTTFSGMLRASMAPTASTQDRALIYNGSTNQNVLADTGSQNNQSWMKYNMPEGAAWQSQNNGQCLDVDELGTIILAPCAATNPKWTTILPTQVTASPAVVPTVVPGLILSMRLLNSGYVGPCVTVRRDSDNTTQDILFNPQAVIDQVALLAFVGAANGYVTTWYDQSSGNHAVQPIAANQPRIVIAGVVEIMVGGAPTINFLGVSQYMQLARFPIRSRYGDIYLVNQQNANATWSRYFDFGVDANTWLMGTPTRDNGQLGLFAQLNGNQVNTSGAAVNDQRTHRVGFVFSRQQLATRLDGKQVSTNTGVPVWDLSTQLRNSQNYIGKSQSADPFLNGRISELVAYNGNLSATQQTNLEISQQTAFNTV